MKAADAAAGCGCGVLTALHNNALLIVIIGVGVRACGFGPVIDRRLYRALPAATISIYTK